MAKSRFWRIHASIIFTLAITIFSLICLVSSIQFGAQHPFTATLLEHLAAMGIAASVAAVFFNFRDVQEILSASISGLLIDGDFIAHLGAKEQTKLRMLLLLRSLEGKVQELPASLTAHLECVVRHGLSVPHLNNFSATTILTDVQGQPGVLHQHYRCNYSVDCHHLKGGKGSYQLRIRQDYTDPSGRLSPSVALEQFHLRVGAQTFGAKDVSVNQRPSGGVTVTSVAFEKDFEVEGEVSVAYSVQALCDTNDPGFIIYAWYPTKGFRASLQYKEGMTYDAAWFKSWTEVAKDFPGREQMEVYPNGISAYTDEWLMPGHGVMLSWFKPEPVLVVAVGGSSGGAEDRKSAAPTSLAQSSTTAEDAAKK